MFSLSLLKILQGWSPFDISCQGPWVASQVAPGRTLDAIIDARKAAGGSGRPPSNEVMMELNYGAQVTSWLRFVPNLQWIINPDQLNEPSRKTNIPDAFVVGCKLVIGLPELFGMSAQKYTH